jgi:HEPN domain-containing protein
VPHDLDRDTWIEQAKRDLRAAEHLLRGDFPGHATVFAHLAVEKALKGVFKMQADTSATGNNPPVTHDLRHLARRVDLTWNRDRQDAIDGLSDVSILALYAPDRPFGHPVSDRTDAARERVADARLLVEWLVRQAGGSDGS